MTTPKTTITAEALKNPRALPPVHFEWEDCEGYVAMVNAYEFDVMECQSRKYAEQHEDRQMASVMFYAAYAVCDEAGKRFFDSGDGDEATAEFVDWINQVAKNPMPLIAKIVNTFCRANKLKTNDLDALAKNSQKTATDAG